MTSSDFFKQCTDDGTCYQRVNPIRIGSDSQDDILKQDMTFHCHITNMNQLEQSDYSDCKIGEKNTMLADHVNLQYENYIYVCTSMNSRYNKKDHKYNCTRLVQKEAKIVDQDPIQSPSALPSVQEISLSSDEDFATFVPETVMKNTKNIQGNTERIKSLEEKHRKSPLPRFGFARG